MMNMEKVEVEMQLEVHKRYKMVRESVMSDVVCEEVRDMEHLSSKADDDVVAATDY
jgi:hypothetical protein